MFGINDVKIANRMENYRIKRKFMLGYIFNTLNIK